MGQPKAWLPFGPEVMLQRIVRILQPVVDPVVVVAAPGQDLPSLPSSIAVVRDPQEHLGPLAGLAEGLRALQRRAATAYLTGCDVPFLQPAFVRCMIELLGDRDACVPDVGGFRHPLAAVYHLRLLPVVEELVASGCLRATDAFDQVTTRIVTAVELQDVDPALQSLQNVNSPGEYQHALQIAVEEWKS